MRLSRKMNWEATDGDGWVYQYEEEPRPTESGGDWWFVVSGDWVDITKGSAPDDWRTTKRYIGDELIVTDIQEVRPVVWAFAQAMEAQIRANEHKEKWLDSCCRTLGDRLSEASDKISCITTDVYVPIDKHPELRTYAVDVANLAMMIWDVLQAKSQEDENES